MHSLVNCVFSLKTLRRDAATEGAEQNLNFYHGLANGTEAAEIVHSLISFY